MSARTLVFATNNDHKLAELSAILGADYKVLGLKDIGCSEEIPETGETLEENARLKATYVQRRFGFDCIADDTGLIVDALGGEPGVKSARYAGPGHNSQANTALLLQRLSGVPQSERSARFRTVIALTRGEEITYFIGEVEGSIADEPRGEGGFGYDPVFIPENSPLTFAQMSADRKNEISHRGRATAALIEYLNANSNL